MADLVHPLAIRDARMGGAARIVKITVEKDRRPARGAPAVWIYAVEFKPL
jgi:hypothetical protein